MNGKTAVGALSAVMTALTVSAIFVTSVLNLTGWAAAVVWVPPLAVMVGTITVAARTAGQSGSC